MDIIEKLKESGLKGRGGANFPTGKKWELVSQQKSDKKYIICNGSEGEPGIFKDKYILENHLDEVIEGIKIALRTFSNSVAYFYLNKKYYPLFEKKLKKLIKGYNIILFEKPDGYICGEETTILNVIEGKRHEPRIKPPYPTEYGLFGYPTLVNNVETFYHVSKIDKGEYNKTRFFCITGDVGNKGVYEFSEDFTVEDVLNKTGNYPKFPFFVQVGGAACGEILFDNELKTSFCGAGALVVYNKKTDPYKLMQSWVDFFMDGNCDRCTPCREGIFRIAEMVKKKDMDKKVLEDLFYTMENTSFCPLGRMAVSPFKTLIYKILK